MAQYNNLAKDILVHIGGEENIQTVGHCLTRLRFVLKDSNAADTVYFAEHPDIFNVIQAAGQYQLVIGHHVPDVYDVLMSMTQLDDQQDFLVIDEKGTFLERLTAFLVAIMGPCLGVMIATGFIKSLVSFLAILGLNESNSALYVLLDVAGNGFYLFLPVFLAYTCSRYVKLNVSLGLAIACALLYPDLNLTRYVDHSVLSYHQTVLPIILAISLAAIAERKLKDWFSKLFRASLVPFFILLLDVPLTFVVTGPLLGILHQSLVAFFDVLGDIHLLLLGLILGGSWSFLAIFGLHWGILPLLLTVLAGPERNLVMGIATLVCFTHLGSLLALRTASKDSRENQLFIPVSLASLLGVFEPSLYSLFLSRPRLLVQIGLAGAFQGAFLAMVQIQPTGGLAGLISLISAFGSGHFIPVVLAAGLGACLSFILTTSQLSKTNLGLLKATQPPHVFEGAKEAVAILNCPVVGEVMPLSEMADPVFASGAMGQGLAFQPLIGELYAPFSGHVLSLFSTQHALSLVDEAGVEVLLHVGIDTVNLGGRGFKSFVKVGDRVNRGDLLLTFDLPLLETEGFQATTALIIRNSQEYAQLECASLSKARPVDEILRIHQREKPIKE